MPNDRPTLLGVPYDASSSYLRGAAKAPEKIREALRTPSSNGWSESGVDILAEGILDEAGDVMMPDIGDRRVAIETRVREVMEAGGRPISLGGDHSITYPILNALGPAHRDLTILQIDAHPDLYDVFEGDRYSHACQFARIMEKGLASRLVQVGIRTANAHQRDQMEEFGVEVIDMMAWQAGRRPALSGPIYLSLDLDGLDPAFAPGVSHPEPGGLTTREVLSVIQSLDGSIVGADVVELNPSRDINNLTAMVAAKFVKEIAARMLVRY